MVYFLADTSGSLYNYSPGDINDIDYVAYVIQAWFLNFNQRESRKILKFYFVLSAWH